MEQRIGKFVRPRRTIDEIRRLVDHFNSGNQSAVAFCKANNICKGTFYKWLSRYNNKSALADEVSGFTSLQITDAGRAAPPGLFAEVHGIKIYQPVPAAYLKEILSA